MSMKFKLQNNLDMTLKQMFQRLKRKLEVLVKSKLIYETKSDLCISKKRWIQQKN